MVVEIHETKIKNKICVVINMNEYEKKKSIPQFSTTQERDTLFFHPLVLHTSKKKL
jgi:hypothetical protein